MCCFLKNEDVILHNQCNDQPEEENTNSLSLTLQCLFRGYRLSHLGSLEHLKTLFFLVHDLMEDHELEAVTFRVSKSVMVPKPAFHNTF